MPNLAIPQWLFTPLTKPRQHLVAGLVAMVATQHKMAVSVASNADLRSAEAQRRVKITLPPPPSKENFTSALSVCEKGKAENG